MAKKDHCIGPCGHKVCQACAEEFHNGDGFCGIEGWSKLSLKMSLFMPQLSRQSRQIFFYSIILNLYHIIMSSGKNQSVLIHEKIETKYVYLFFFFNFFFFKIKLIKWLLLLLFNISHWKFYKSPFVLRSQFNQSNFQSISSTSLLPNLQVLRGWGINCLCELICVRLACLRLFQFFKKLFN